GGERRVEGQQVLESLGRRARREAERPRERLSSSDDEWQGGERGRVAGGAGQRATEIAAVLAVDPAAHVGAELLIERGDPWGEHAHVAQIDLEVLQPSGPDQRDRKAD